MNYTKKATLNQAETLACLIFQPKNVVDNSNYQGHNVIMFLKKTDNYFTNHPEANALAHLSIGLGAGVLLGPWVFDPHPVRWAVGLIALGVLIHIFPLALKK